MIYGNSVVDIACLLGKQNVLVNGDHVRNHTHGANQKDLGYH